MAHTDPQHSGLNHEPTDVDLSGANRFIVVMTVFLAVAFGFIYVVFTKWEGDARATQPAPSPVAARDGDRLPPLPRLQTTPYVDLKAFKASEEQVLTTYAWVDKEQGLVRLPIRRAIDLVVERGIPTFGPAPTGAAAAAPTAGTPASTP